MPKQGAISCHTGKTIHYISYILHYPFFRNIAHNIGLIEFICMYIFHGFSAHSLRTKSHPPSTSATGLPPSQAAHLRDIEKVPKVAISEAKRAQNRAEIDPSAGQPKGRHGDNGLKTVQDPT